MTTIGQKIRLERQRFGMSMQQLADAAGITRATVFDLERGKCMPKLATAVEIADAFGLTVSELIGQTAPSLSEQERRVIAALRNTTRTL